MIYQGMEIYNCKEIITVPDYEEEIICRIPNALRLQLNSLAKRTACHCAGVELRFNPVDPIITVRLKVQNIDKYFNKKVPIEIYYGCFQDPNYVIVGEGISEIMIKKPELHTIMNHMTQDESLPFDSNLVRIVLPYSAQVSIIDVIGNIRIPESHQSPKKKWLVYGSSISHGSSAYVTSSSYVSSCSKKLGVDLINLGFPGSAMIEAEMADYIADNKDWDIALLELGINAKWDFETLTDVPVEVFINKIDYFINRIAFKNPAKKIICMDMFLWRGDYDGDENTIKYRAALKEKVQSMHSENVLYINGRELLNKSSGLCIDLIHPSSDGMDEIAVNLSNYMQGLL